MSFKYLMGIAATAAVAFAGAAQADTVVYNSTPADGWFYGSGNDYVPANTAVLTTDAGDQLYLRAHQTFVTAPASVGDTYSFVTGLPFISFDWGFDNASALSGVTASITMTNYAGGASFSYDPFVLTPDNATGSGSTQNSARLNWFSFATGFNPAVDGSYDVRLDVAGLAGGDKSLNIRVDVGAGFVPEPGTWALMILGFGGAGAALRRRRGMALA